MKGSCRHEIYTHQVLLWARRGKAHFYTNCTDSGLCSLSSEKCHLQRARYLVIKHHVPVANATFSTAFTQNTSGLAKRQVEYHEGRVRVAWTSYARARQGAPCPAGALV